MVFPLKWTHLCHVEDYNEAVNVTSSDEKSIPKDKKFTGLSKFVLKITGKQIILPSLNFTVYLREECFLLSPGLGRCESPPFRK